MAEGPAAAGDSSHRVVKEMGITHADFFRIVPSLLAGEEYELRDDGVTMRRDAAAIDIRLGPERARVLGNIRLPRTRVEIEFRHCAPAAIAEFVERFDRRFRRGGG